MHMLPEESPCSIFCCLVLAVSACELEESSGTKKRCETRKEFLFPKIWRPLNFSAVKLDCERFAGTMSGSIWMYTEEGDLQKSFISRMFTCHMYSPFVLF